MKALREQAATGDAEAQYRLGARLYEDKKGAEAERFLKLAAAQDHAEACFALGEAYAAPVDDQMRLDLQEALKYFRKAARAGHAAARRRAAFLDDVFREAAAEGPEAPIFDDDNDAARKDDAAAAAAAAHNARMALEGPAAPGIDRGAIREATEALRALGMSPAELRERS
jgi:TPR repeat protein